MKVIIVLLSVLSVTACATTPTGERLWLPTIAKEAFEGKYADDQERYERDVNAVLSAPLLVATVDADDIEKARGYMMTLWAKRRSLVFDKDAMRQKLSDYLALSARD